ncbi:MAG: hypothetical protein RJA07_1355 [Bacteroidota bacterium]|jgi:hypothetical protein
MFFADSFEKRYRLELLKIQMISRTFGKTFASVSATHERLGYIVERAGV